MGGQTKKVSLPEGDAERRSLLPSWKKKQRVSSVGLQTFLQGRERKINFFVFKGKDKSAAGGGGRLSRVGGKSTSHFVLMFNQEKSEVGGNGGGGPWLSSEHRRVTTGRGVGDESWEVVSSL